MRNTKKVLAINTRIIKKIWINKKNWGAFGGGKKWKIGAPGEKNCRAQMILRLPQGHEDSKYVFSFEIGQREGGFYSAQQTDRQTHPVPH